MLLTGVLATALLAGVSPAVAAPGSSDSSSVDIKQAEKILILRDLERMKVELASQVRKFVNTGRRIEQTQQEIAKVDAEISSQDEALVRAEAALVQRAVQLYRTDRLGLMEILFSADSIPQLMDRMSYLVAAGRHDNQLIDRVRLERQESLWLQESMTERFDLLNELQASADEQRKQIERDIAVQEARAASIGEDIFQLMQVQSTGSDSSSSSGSSPQADFDPNTIISEQRFRNVAAMSAVGIQDFLDDQPGRLKSYRGLNYEGKSMSAAEMIAEACAAWSVNPEVMLVTLQKEQSLLADASPTQRALDWALGVGKTDSRTFTKYQGFGNQIWYGAKTFNNNANRWRAGVKLNIDGATVTPSNGATHSLYKYTPHRRGNMSFWMIFWRYFGNPLGLPTASPS